MPSWSQAFGVALAVRLVAAALVHITDCDETFNYWDPVCTRTDRFKQIAITKVVILRACCS